MLRPYSAICGRKIEMKLNEEDYLEAWFFRRDAFKAIRATGAAAASACWD